MEQTILLVVQVLSAVALVGLILIQQGKGADMGASFGSGASQTVFGSGGSGNFLTRTTAILATVFFLSSLGMAYMAKKQSELEAQIPFSVPVIEASGETSVPLGYEDLPAIEEASLTEDSLPVIEASTSAPEKSVGLEGVPAVEG
ncbi:MAG: preprotein translocase subunit SecG [Pseudomonadales bacterium]|nr:preprotein translocase subunit SecG [Pseudomonadales bacterium]